jgi:hypothetical protein
LRSNFPDTVIHVHTHDTVISNSLSSDPQNHLSFGLTVQMDIALRTG